MLEIAGGVVLGGAILYSLYICREIIGRIVVWGGLAIVGIVAVGTVLLGGWRIVHRLLYSPKSDMTTPEELFIGMIFWTSVLLVSKIFDHPQVEYKDRPNLSNKV